MVSILANVFILISWQMNPVSPLQTADFRAKHNQEIQVYQKKLELQNRKFKSQRESYDKEVKLLRAELDNLRTQEQTLLRMEKDVSLFIL
jgi:hypothetical protein